MGAPTVEGIDVFKIAGALFMNRDTSSDRERCIYNIPY